MNYNYNYNDNGEFKNTIDDLKELGGKPIINAIKEIENINNLNQNSIFEIVKEISSQVDEKKIQIMNDLLKKTLYSENQD